MLLIDKPVGISSFGVVANVRRVTGIKKVGHAGTLDPLASGLMLILVGKDETKRAAELLGLDKSYETVVRIGESRTTGDLEGEVVTRATNIGNVTRETLEKALNSMIGTLQLPVPAYSAIKRDGKRLYKMARHGDLQERVDNNDFKLPVRDMVVYSARLIDMREVVLWDSPESCRCGYEATVVFAVASGVYIRSLSEELGRRLVGTEHIDGLPATTAGLRRISIGEYSIDDAQTLDDMDNDKKLIHVEVSV